MSDHERPSAGGCVAVLLAVTAFIVVPARAQLLSLQRIAEVGDPAPGFEDQGLRFSGFGNLPVHEAAGDPPPRIDRDGTITFHAFADEDGIPNTEPPFGQSALYRVVNGVFELVVKVGDPALGTSSTFAGFPGAEPLPFSETPYLQAGRLAFHATTADDPQLNGLWSDRFGPLELVVRDGDELPGPPPGTLSLFADAFRGQTVVINGLTGSGGSQREGLWRDAGGGFETIATDRVPAPGTEPGVTFGEGTELAFFGSIDDWDVNVNGEVVFNGYLAGPPAVCGDGICESAQGENCLVCPDDCAGVQSGNPANRFCCGGGGGDNPVDCGDPRCVSGGFDCTDGLLIDPDNDEGIWMLGPQGVQLVMREGDPAPQAGPDHVFGSGANGELGGLATFGGEDEIPSRINDNGALLLGASISSPDFYSKSAIWTTRSGSLDLFLTGSLGLPEEPGGPANQFPGDPAPGLSGGTFSEFVFGDQSNEGSIAVLARAILNDDPLDVTTGIWWDAPGALTLVAALGMPVPGVPGATFTSLFYKVETFNDWTHVLFFGEFPGSGQEGQRPLFRANPDGTVDRVLGAGDQVLVNGDEIRTVLAFAMGEGQSADGRRAFEVDFTDGSSGIFTAQIIPPAADINGDGVVDVLDFLALLAAWGPCPPTPHPCPADLDGDGQVGVTDFLILLAAWT